MCAMAGGTQASAAQITGFSDGHVAEWGAGANAYLSQSGITTERLVIPWNVVDSTSELEATTRWIRGAESQGKQIMISFDHPPLCPAPPDPLHPCTNPGIPYTLTYAEKVHKFRTLFPEVAYYTAWNEPNHHVSPTGQPESNPADSSVCEPIATGLCGAIAAASYWNTMNEECHKIIEGHTCSVIAGDFLDGQSPEGIKGYMKQYGENLLATPPAWGLHPYATVDYGTYKPNEASSLNSFLALTNGLPVWFTEVGAYFCNRSDGPRGETGQAGDVTNLVALLNRFSNKEVPQTFYYGFASVGGGYTPCIASNGTYPFDTYLLGAHDHPRLAMKMLFPQTEAINGAASNSAAIGTDGRQYVYYKTASGSITEEYNNGNGWLSSTFGSGNAVGEPVTAAAPADDDVLHVAPQFVYFRGAAGSLWQSVYNSSGSWSTTQIPGSFPAAGDPSLIIGPDGHRNLYYRGTDGQIWQDYWDGVKWYNQALGGSAAGDPSAVRAWNGTQYVYFRTPSGTIAEDYYNGVGWVSNIVVGGPAAGDPTVTIDSRNRQYVYFRGSDSAIWENYWDGAQWHVIRVGGAAVGDPAAALDANGRQYVYFRGTNGTINEWYWNGIGWLLNSGVGGSPTGDPSPVVDPDGYRYIWWRGSDGAVWEDYWNGNGWLSNLRIG